MKRIFYSAVVLLISISFVSCERDNFDITGSWSLDKLSFVDGDLSLEATNLGLLVFYEDNTGVHELTIATGSFDWESTKYTLIISGISLDIDGVFSYITKTAEKIVISKVDDTTTTTIELSPSSMEVTK
jgi:hypothetical protein